MILSAFLALAVAGCASIGPNMGQYDKKVHAGGSYAATVVAGEVFGPVKGALIVLAAGAAKELIDPYIGGVRDIKDFAADAGGVMFGYLTSHLLHWEW
ncbi:MAG TPA: hypothetical protein VKA67_05220 [Verrucomicrobiae bacterium]|nr:hypothetical protein [Verrucomicrobiae bacterium]